MFFSFEASAAQIWGGGPFSVALLEADRQFDVCRALDHRQGARGPSRALIGRPGLARADKAGQECRGAWSRLKIEGGEASGRFQFHVCRRTVLRERGPGQPLLLQRTGGFLQWTRTPARVERMVHTQGYVQKMAKHIDLLMSQYRYFHVFC